MPETVLTGRWSLECRERWTNRGRQAAREGRPRIASRTVVSTFRRYWLHGWDEETLNQRKREYNHA